MPILVSAIAKVTILSAKKFSEINKGYKVIHWDKIHFSGTKIYYKGRKSTAFLTEFVKLFYSEPY